MEGLIATPIFKTMERQTGKTIAQFKTNLHQLIREINNDNRPIYVVIPGSYLIATNINNDEYIVEDGSDLALWITCVHSSGDFAHIEFTSYNLNKRYIALMDKGRIVGY